MTIKQPNWEVVGEPSGSDLSLDEPPHRMPSISLCTLKYDYSRPFMARSYSSSVSPGRVAVNPFEPPSMLKPRRFTVS